MGGTVLLEVVDVRIEPRKDWVFAGSAGAFEAVNAARWQILAGLDADDGITGVDGGYLATLTLAACADASGPFTVDVDHGDSAQTFLVAPGQREIAIRRVIPAVIDIAANDARR